ncbi:MAG: DUF4126 family protein [Candidatus Korobacteraceae bacterium]|jgi:uncharacterized membrane protein
MNHVLLLAVGIGVVAGLRAMTAPAFVSWAAYSHWINLAGTPLAFMGSPITVGIFTLLAIVELVADVMPKTPPRTAPVGLIARIVTGGLSGACIYAAAAATPITGAILGIIGALIGTYGGYHIRRALDNSLKVKDIFIAIPEDIVAFVLAYCIVR